jgi:hypothetical protein
MKILQIAGLLAALPVLARAQTVTVTQQPTEFGTPMFTSSLAEFSPNTSTGGWGWFGDMRLSKPDSQAEIDRIGKEAESGRAEAALMLSHFLPPLPDGTEDCASILKFVREAKALGAARADYELGQYYANKTCGEGHGELAIQPFLDAFKRDNVFAAIELSKLYDAGPKSVRDPVMAYAYGEFAMQRMAKWPQQLPAHMQPKPDVLRASLSRKELQRASEALRDLAAMTETHRAKTANSMSKRVISTDDSGSTPPGWTYRFLQVDHTGECFDNLANNCSGVPQLILGRLTNNSSETLICELGARLPEYVGGDALDASYKMIIAPNAQRTVVVGESQAKIPSSRAFSARCGRIALEAATFCKANLVGDGRGDPPAGTNMSGTAWVRALVFKGEKQPADVEIARTSGNPQLDAAARKVVRKQVFDVNCKGSIALTTVSVAFSGS